MNIKPETHPSNVIKFCPVCGNKSFSFSGDKFFTCGSCGFIYFINPAPAVAAVIESPDGRIVLTRRKHEPLAGMLDLPGGFVDMMESAEEAIRREIKEELGINVGPLAFLGTCPNEYVYRGLSYFTCDLGFVCSSVELEQMHPADDVSEAILIRPEDIDFREIGFPSIEYLLKQYVNRKTGKIKKR